jgi:hypothetical protein
LIAERGAAEEAAVGDEETIGIAEPEATDEAPEAADPAKTGGVILP